MTELTRLLVSSHPRVSLDRSAYSLLFSLGTYLDFGASAFNLTYNGKMSFSGRFRFKQFLTSQALITKQRRSSPFDGWGFYLTSDKKLQFQYVTTGTTNHHAAETAKIDFMPGRFYTIGFSYDNKTLNFYVDNRRYAATTVTNTLTSTYAGNPDLNIGNRQKFEGVGDNSLLGYANECGITTSTIWTDEEFVDIYKNCSFPETAQEVWHLDEGTGTAVAGSVSGINGTITSAVWKQVS